ncbi:hypothetical protein [Absidia glauca]|uniref:C2H2-type domain-containing protein n=1 Tax=Absidia glauca TaxID=4829 RepID=A0A163KCU8_ABSGL|nr:hypothetical protein [Absidia glauca]
MSCLNKPLRQTIVNAALIANVKGMSPFLLVDPTGIPLADPVVTNALPFLWPPTLDELEDHYFDLNADDDADNICFDGHIYLDIPNSATPTRKSSTRWVILTVKHEDVETKDLLVGPPLSANEADSDSVYDILRDSGRRYEDHNARSIFHAVDSTSLVYGSNPNPLTTPQLEQWYQDNDKKSLSAHKADDHVPEVFYGEDQTILTFECPTCQSEMRITRGIIRHLFEQHALIGSKTKTSLNEQSSAESSLSPLPATAAPPAPTYDNDNSDDDQQNEGFFVSRTDFNTGFCPMTPQPIGQFQTIYGAMDNGLKWKLGSSGRFVEDILFAHGMKLRNENCIHSFILGTDDDDVRDQFDADEWKEVETKYLKENPSLPDNVVKLLGDFSKSDTVYDILRDSGRRYEDHNTQGVFYAIYTMLLLYESNPNPLMTPLLEQWDQANVWAPVMHKMLGNLLGVNCVLGESGSLASEERKR